MDVVSGMCESCVAPILILIISMFYKKDEQVCLSTTRSRATWLTVNLLPGNAGILVLRHGVYLATGTMGCILTCSPQNGKAWLYPDRIQVKTDSSQA